MGFDVKGFKKAKFKDRTKAIDVPELAEFFGEDEKPEWVIRGLSGEEAGRVKEAVSSDNSNRWAMFQAALESGTDAEKIEALKAQLGDTSKSPKDYAERVENLVIASVSPKCDTELAVILAKRFPYVFYKLTNEVLKATGLGMEPGKPKRSIKTQVSEAP